MRLLLIIILIFNSILVSAENSRLVSDVADLESGRNCAKLEAPQLGFVCTQNHGLWGAHVSGYEILKNLAFDQAADKQEKIDRCVMERIDAMKASKKNTAEWIGALTQAWLGQRKAKLMYMFCEGSLTGQMWPDEVDKIGPDAAFKRIADFKRKLAKKYHKDEVKVEEDLKALAKWKNICLDRQTMGALKNARTLFLNAMPVAGAEGFFDDLDRRRDIFVDTKTGKPRSDTEILNMDLRDTSASTFRVDASLVKSFYDRLSELAEARASSAFGLKEAKRSDGHFDLSDRQRQYIFDDGTLEAVLRQTLNEKQYPAAAACLTAHFGPSPLGEIVNLGVWTAATAGIAGLAFKGVGALATMSRLAKARKALAVGALVGDPAQLVTKVWTRCFADRMKHASAERDKTADASAMWLPDSTHFERSNVNIDPSQTPACEDGDAQNLVLRIDNSRSCTNTVLWDVLPIAAGLPIPK